MTKNYNAFVAACIFVLSSAMQIYAQDFEKLDKVPHDIAYFRQSKVSKPLIKVIYGRPTDKGEQEVFGTKIPYNEVWRTGANEATEVKFYNDVYFGETLVKAGTYVLYSIPGKKHWKVILNSDTDVLGAFQYNPNFNVATVEVPVNKAEKLETFSIAFKPVEINSVNMVLAWKSTRVKVPIKNTQSTQNTFVNADGSDKVILFENNKSFD